MHGPWGCVGIMLLGWNTDGALDREVVYFWLQATVLRLTDSAEVEPIKSLSSVSHF